MRVPALVTVLLSATVAAAQGLPNVSGMAYSQARSALLKNGYLAQPLPAPRRVESRCRSGLEQICSSYPETRWCRHPGRGGCEFVLMHPNEGPVSLIIGGDEMNLVVESIRRMSNREVTVMLAE
jgi:hypothetical protein